MPTVTIKSPLGSYAAGDTITVSDDELKALQAEAKVYGKEDSIETAAKTKKTTKKATKADK